MGNDPSANREVEVAAGATARGTFDGRGDKLDRIPDRPDVRRKKTAVGGLGPQVRRATVFAMWASSPRGRVVTEAPSPSGLSPWFRRVISASLVTQRGRAKKLLPRQIRPAA